MTIEPYWKFQTFELNSHLKRDFGQKFSLTLGSLKVELTKVSDRQNSFALSYASTDMRSSKYQWSNCFNFSTVLWARNTNKLFGKNFRVYIQKKFWNRGNFILGIINRLISKSLILTSEVHAASVLRPHNMIYKAGLFSPKNAKTAQSLKYLSQTKTYNIFQTPKKLEIWHLKTHYFFSIQ